uniref:Uncharacterized protein n=1 Tax=Arundo donax TaxID=35708 RepID=A0A0A9CPY2_ARUDO
MKVIMPMVHLERCFVFINRMHPDLMVACEHIQFCEEPCLCQLIQYLINHW